MVIDYNLESSQNNQAGPYKSSQFGRCHGAALGSINDRCQWLEGTVLLLFFSLYFQQVFPQHCWVRKEAHRCGLPAGHVTNFLGQFHTATGTLSGPVMSLAIFIALMLYISSVHAVGFCSALKAIVQPKTASFHPQGTAYSPSVSMMLTPCLCHVIPQF